LLQRKQTVKQLPWLNSLSTNIFALVQADKFLGDRQANPAALVQHTAGDIVLEKGLEYPLHLIFPDAYTCIYYLYLQLALLNFAVG
jgi:hypothetical protein